MTKGAHIGWAILVAACQPAVVPIAPAVDSSVAPVASVAPAADPMATLMERELLVAKRFGEDCHFERDCGALWDVKCGSVHHFVKAATLDELGPPAEWTCATREAE